jgi:signal peptidase II
MGATPERVRLFRYALAAAVLFAAVDLVSKWVMATIFLDQPTVISVLPFFNLVLVFNRGVSFGMLGDLGPWGPYILSTLAAAIMVFLVVWLRRTERPNEAMGIAMILGGAAGNLIDRMHDGAVTDFLDLYVGKYHWPAFNGADIFITMGVLCLLFPSIGSRWGFPRRSRLDR